MVACTGLLHACLPGHSFYKDDSSGSEQVKRFTCVCASLRAQNCLVLVVLNAASNNQANIHNSTGVSPGAPSSLKGTCSRSSSKVLRRQLSYCCRGEKVRVEAKHRDIGAKLVRTAFWSSILGPTVHAAPQSRVLSMCVPVSSEVSFS